MNRMILISLMIGLAACGQGSGGKQSASTAIKVGEKQENEKEIKIKEVKSGIDTIDSYQRVQASAFVVKNNLQLRSATDACLGPGLGTITDDMFAPGRCAADPTRQDAMPPPPGGGPGNEKLVILGADKCGARGQHVYEVLSDQLWSPDLAGRTDTLANQLTPSYLQALALAADVYAHGVNQPMSYCDTLERSRDLVSRCLGQYSVASREMVAQTINTLCLQGAVKAREAIATVLGSAAFAAAIVRDGGNN